MPQIIFKGTEEADIINISKELLDELEKQTEIPRDYFTLEYVETVYIMDGERIKLYPLIEIIMFDRGEEIKDKIAGITDRLLRKEGYEQIEIYFTDLKKRDYYENGEHY